MSVAMPRVMTRGVVFVHSTPTALCPHITWALESVLDARLSIEWTPQPAGAALVRAEFPWTGAQGTGAKLASALRGWDNLRYEVTEEPSPGADGSRWSHTPAPGDPPHVDLGVRRRGHQRGPAARGAAAGPGLAPRPCRRWSRSCSAPTGTPSSSRSATPGTGRPVRWLHKVG